MKNIFDLPIIESIETEKKINSNQAELLSAVNTGKIDAVITDSVIAAYICNV